MHECEPSISQANLNAIFSSLAVPVLRAILSRFLKGRYRPIKSLRLSNKPTCCIATAQFFNLEGQATNLWLTKILFDPTQAETECFAAAMGTVSKGWEVALIASRKS